MDKEILLITFVNFSVRFETNDCGINSSFSSSDTSIGSGLMTSSVGVASEAAVFSSINFIFALSRSAGDY